MIDELAEVRELVGVDDPEMAAEAQEELRASRRTDRGAVEADAQDRCSCRTIRCDDRNAIVEIRAGTGGDEAALFAGDLFRMYTRYTERKGWKVEMLSLSGCRSGRRERERSSSRRPGRVR